MAIQVLLEFLGSRNEVLLQLDDNPLSKLQEELRKFESLLVLVTKSSTVEAHEEAYPIYYILQRWSGK